MSKEYFQEVASDWDEMQKSFFSDNIRELAFNSANIEQGDTAADIGAGTGYLTQGLLSRGLEVVAIDQSKNMLDVLINKFQTEGKLSCKVGDAEKLPLNKNSVDFSFANMYLHHVETPQNAIEEMARIIKPGGKVVITDLDSHDYDFLENEHYDRWKGFDREDVKNWFENAGLKDVQVLSTEEKCSSESTSGDLASITVFLAIGTK